MTSASPPAKAKQYFSAVLNFSALAVTILFSVTLSPKISLFVKDGIRLCFEAIIGSVFPFMIISDAVLEIAKFDSSRTLKRIFEKLFKINGRAVSAFLLGSVCGFPVGVKLSHDLYNKGVITKNECERLIGFSSNMSPAFIISGIGAALCKSITLGLIFYAVTIASAIFSGILLGLGKSPSDTDYPDTPSAFSLTLSIKSATKNTATICGFIIFFSVVCGVLSIAIKNEIFYTFCLPFLEISNAAKHVSALTFIENNSKFAIMAFAISFSGLSVYMQAKSFFTEEKISMKPYLFAKVLSALISAILMILIVKIIQK